MIIFLLATSVRTKYWNSFTIVISGPAFMLMYNNSTSPVLLVCDPNLSITSPTDLLSNFPFPNDYEILFL